MHVPAYCPVVVGVQASEKSGVVTEVKNVMLMEDMDIIDEEEDDMSIPEEVAMGIDDIVIEGVLDVDMLISILKFGAGFWPIECWIASVMLKLRSYWFLAEYSRDLVMSVQNYSKDKVENGENCTEYKLQVLEARSNYYCFSQKLIRVSVKRLTPSRKRAHHSHFSSGTLK